MRCMLLLGALALLVVPAAAQAQIAVSDAQASEGTGAITFTITRQAGLLAPAATVSFQTSDGSATAPADYTAAGGQRTFGGSLLGETQTRHVTVAVASDALDEPDETINLAVSGAGVSDGSATGTIVDDDAAPAVAVSDAPPAAEGASATFAVGLNRPSGQSVSVAYSTADGSATAGQDYTARSGRVTIPAGSTSVSVGVALTDDGADEPSESFELRLSVPTGATLGDSVAAATIIDNDEPPQAAPGPGSGTSPPGGPPLPSSSGSGGAAGSVLPQLGVSRPRLRLPSTILVTVSCPRQSTRCSGRMTIFSRPNRRSKIKQLRVERRMGRRNFNLPGGASQTLRIALSRRDQVLLKRAGRINVRAYILTTDSSGRSGVRRVNGVLVGRTSHG